MSTPTKSVRRAVVKVECVHGYRGHPSTVMTLTCGHQVWFQGSYVWQVKRKTTICNDCTKAARSNDLALAAAV